MNKKPPSPATSSSPRLSPFPWLVKPSLTYSPTNTTDWLTQTRSIQTKNGPRITETLFGDKWTRTTRSTSYDEDGTRIEITTTETSDSALVTDRISRTDFLGRITSVVTPQSTTTTTYDGASSRVLSSTKTTSSGPIQTTYEYDTHGDLVSTTTKNVTLSSVTTYETINNEVWRVETQTHTSENSVLSSSQKTQLTGLSNALRSHVISTDVDGEVSETRGAFRAGENRLVETTTFTLRPSITRKSMLGRIVELLQDTGNESYFFESYGRVFYTEKYSLITPGWVPASRNSYDSLGELLKTETFVGPNETAQTSIVRDAFGRAIAVTNALGNATFAEYDPLGRTIHTWGATYPARYEYDAKGRLTSLSTTHDGTTWNTTSWTYDPATGYPTSKTYSDGTTITYTQTSDGMPLRTTTAQGRWTENAYNTNGELISVDYSGETPTDFYEHNTDGFVIATSNTVSSTISSVSSLGIATNEVITVGTNTVVMTRSLDAYSRQTGLHISGQLPLSYRYNEKNQLDCVQNLNGWMEYIFARDGYCIGYDVYVDYAYQYALRLERDAYRRNLVTRDEFNPRGHHTLLTHEYGHDLLGRRISRIDNETVTNTFAYNPRNEVRSATINGLSSQYGYTDIGNFTAKVCGSVTNAYVSNSVNQYSFINETSLAYDLDGNLLTNGVWSYTWDDANRLSTVSSNGVLLVTNQYDTRSRRVLKITPTATHTYFYDDWNLVLEYVDYPDGSRDTISYVWALDLSGTMQGAGGVGGLAWVKYNDTLYIPHYDANGNVMDYYDGTTKLPVASYTYDAFGRTIAQSGPMATFFRHRFSTKYYDEETDLYYYGYRFYSPEMGRWLNRDPIEENDNCNLYLFLRNTSINYIDALGLRTYHRGPREEPEFSFDEDFPYDEDVSPTMGDWLRRIKWWTFVQGASFVGNYRYSLPMYKHYRSGLGTDVTIDYSLACYLDDEIFNAVDEAIEEAKEWAVKLTQKGDRKFTMCSDGGVTENPATEDWQKTIGRHTIWCYAEVEINRDMYLMDIWVNMIDRYNFNKGDVDIKTEIPDDENGRFSTLGWAKSFIVRGSLHRFIHWQVRDNSECRSSLKHE